MPHKSKTRTILENLEVQEVLTVGGVAVVPEGSVSAVVTTPATLVSKTQLLRLEEVTLPATALTATDNGDATGGFIAQELLTLPNTRMIVVGAFLDLEVTAVSEEIGEDAVLAVGVGTTAADDSTPTGTQIDILGPVAVTLTTGAGSGVGISGTALLHIDSTGETQDKVYLNVGIPDASISATGTITVAAVLRLFYIDLSMGA